MLDMDGTILDLAFDNYVWRKLVPERYAKRENLPLKTALKRLYAKYSAIQGDLEWYCLDRWSERLGFDVLQLHREVHHRIVYLPGAQAFLEAVKERDIEVLLVTNSHPGTLTLKDETLGFSAYFDGLHSSHSYGYAKEHQKFWQALQEEIGFDPATTLFVDDTVPVLQSAADFGVEMLVSVTRPDTGEPVQDGADFAGVERVSELL